MKFIVEPSSLKGTATIPGSKSNTTRAVFIASLAQGRSVIMNPLVGRDCISTVEVCRGFGAQIEMGTDWVVEGLGGRLICPDDVLDMGNSGTTYYIATAVAALVNGFTVINGDHQIRYRPAGPLVNALNDLGAMALSTRGGGVAPLVVRGVLRGGKTSLPGVNSQWLTPLLLTAPLAQGDTEVLEDDLQERPYIDMTMGWLSRQGIDFSHDNYERFLIRGGQSYRAFEEAIPADWESATFPLVAAAVTDSEITLMGLDTGDFQGDKAIVDILGQMGADVEVRDSGRGGITVKGGRKLTGIEIDCGDLPDAPPILAVLATRAAGKTVLHNLGASRLKETDRPGSIYEELTKMGARMKMDADSLTVWESDLTGTTLDGHTDHRIVMSCAVAGLIAKGTTVVSDAEYHAISFPTFYEVMSALGADISTV